MDCAPVRRTSTVVFWLKLVVAWTLIPASILVLAEAVARVCLPDPAFRMTSDVQSVLALPGCPNLGPAFDFDPYLFWALKPGLADWRVQGTLENHPIDFSFSTTEGRLRVVPGAAETGGRVILALGDSCTFGFGVNDGETWPAQLKSLLNRERPGDGFRVVNAGVPGYTAFQGLEYLKRCGLALQPDLVIVSFWVNDQMPTASISDEARAAQYARFRHDGILMYSRFYAGVKQLLKGAPPLWSGAEQKQARLTPEQYEQDLREIHAACAERGIPVIFLIWPLAWQVKLHAKSFGYQDVAQSVAAAVGAPLLNLASEFADSADNPFADMIHGNAAGCALAARLIAAEVTRLMPAASR